MTSQTPSRAPVTPAADAEQRQRSTIIRLVRAAFFVLTVTFTFLFILQPPEDEIGRAIASQWWVPLLLGVALFGFALAVDLATPRKKIATITGVLVGVLAGLLATLALGFVIDLVLESWVPNKDASAALKPLVNATKILLGITLCYLGVTTVLQTQDEFRLVIPYVEFAKQFRGVRPLLIDSSALIDGRLVDVAQTGFIQAPVLIPRFVVGELQLLADSEDAMRRAKGRRGLDVITRLQRSPKLDVSINETPVPGMAVDQMLVELARQLPAVIVTADVALSRIAAIQSVPVLNLNDLANSLKASLIAGEKVTVRLLKPGEQAGQGVGYLEDGTMVVAEDGAPMIGQTVEMTITTSLQTSAGRMLFARIAPAEERPAPQPEAPAAETPASEPATTPDAQAPPRPRGPFPPKPPASIKAGTPRNPRR